MPCRYHQSHKDYVIIALMGMLDMWRIDIIENT